MNNFLFEDADHWTDESSDERTTSEDSYEEMIVESNMRHTQLPYMTPPPLDKSPLWAAPDEIILLVIAFLSHPLTIEPAYGISDDLVAFSTVHSRFRALCYSNLYRSVAIRMPVKKSSRDYPAAVQAKQSQVNFLLNHDLCQHIQSLWLDLGSSRQALDLLEGIDKLLVQVAPRLLSLSLERWMASLVGLTAIMNAPRLRYLRMDDGFVGTSGLARQLPENYEGLNCLKDVYCSIDTFPAASAVPFKLIRKLPFAEKVVIRGYRERFAAGFFQPALWSSLRILALDAGGLERPQFPSLFREFQEYRQYNSSPLEEIVLESRSPEPNEFELIVMSLKGHLPLKKLSLMVTPRYDPAFLGLIAETLPQLEELHLVAHASAFLVWIGSVDAYAGAIAIFPNLKVFGFNGLPSTRSIGAQTTPNEIMYKMSVTYRRLFDRCKKLQKFVIWKDFGSTHYYGSCLDLGPRNDEGNLILFEENSHDLGNLLQRAAERRSFFPYTAGTEIVD